MATVGEEAVGGRRRRMGRVSGVQRALVSAWVVVTAIPLLAMVVHILTRPDFPIGLGFIRTRGLMGLWVTLLPAVVALGGVVTLGLRRRMGAAMLLAYSVFWSVLLAGALPLVWNAESSFCFRGLGVCITAAWLGRAVVLLLLSFCLLVFAWTWHALRSDGAARAKGAMVGS